MAPAYRNQNRRQNRTGYIDHDVLEGLPVRQWRRDYTTIVPPAAQESAPLNDIWAVELPHGMPKDSHLLPQHSQDLLRAARSGKIYKRPLFVEEEEPDVEAIIGDKPEKKDDDAKDKGYTVKAWKPIPRHLEVPAVEYLAKRRKGLITVTAKPASTGPTLTKATVKRIDAAGNEYVQDIVVPQGEKVEGEVISQTTIPDPNGSLGDGLIAPTPPKRKGPPKRKPKGPGRGRKKKPIAPTSAPQIPQVDGAGASMDGVTGTLETEAVKIENEDSSTPLNNEDTEMVDGSTHDSDDEEGEEGEEGEDDEDGSVETPGSPSKPARPLSLPPQELPTITHIPSIEQPDPSANISEAISRPSPLHIEREGLEIKSGSPLKNVIMTNSTLTSPLESPGASTAAPFLEPSPIEETKPNKETTEHEHEPESEPAILDEIMQEEATTTTPTTLPPVPAEPTLAEEIASTELLKEEEEEEEMLLDIVENANNAKVGEAETMEPIPSPQPHQTMAQEPEAVSSEPSKVETEETEKKSEEPVVPAERVNQIEIVEPAEPVTVEKAQSEAPQPIDDEDDGFPDLLGGLEKQLNEPIEGLSKEDIPKDNE